MIGIVGGGRVGFTVALAVSMFNEDVLIVDTNEEIVKKINSNEIPFYDKSYEVINKNYLKNIVATTSYKALEHADTIIICVPEEVVIDVIRKSIDYIKNKLVIIKSTVPIGTTETVSEIIEEKYKIGKDVYLAYVPEFLRMGTALQDFLEPDRVIIGVEDDKSLKITYDFIKKYQKPKKIFVTKFRTAELAKLASNAFLAMKISFINEIATLAKILKIDARELSRLIGSDSRIGIQHLNPGIGFGGSCLPKDLELLIREFTNRNLIPKLLLATKEVNDLLHLEFYFKLVEVLGNLKGKRVAVLGLSFKPNTDDVRNSPAKRVISVLINNGCEVFAYDPVATDNFKNEYKISSIRYCKSIREAIKNVDAIVIVTEWEEFKNIKTDKPIIDLRGIDELKNRCEKYFGMFW